MSKRSFAIVQQVLRHGKVIGEALAAVPQLEYHNKALAYILVYEQCISEQKGLCRGGGALPRRVKKFENELRDALPLDPIQASSPKDDPSRFVRINTCQVSPQKLQVLLEKTPEIDVKQIYADSFVPNVLVLPPSATAKIQNTLVKENLVVMQSQPSCFPAFCLARYHRHTKGSSVLDACAAPGNKTTHLASLFPDSTCILAWDRDPDRHDLLRRRTEALAPGRVQTQNVDYLTTPIPSDVTAILLDPSCSGSHTCDDRRLKALASFQTQALTKALACDHVTTVVYSTCSTQVQENEAVVAASLSQSEGWQLVPAIPSWPTRGKAYSGLTREQSVHLLRVNPSNSGQQQRGFFVACLVRGHGPRSAVDWTVSNPLSLPWYEGQDLRSEAPAPIAKTASQPALTSKQANDMDSRTAHSKKRAKKLDWKRRQRESKKARLERISRDQQNQQAKDKHVLP